MFSKLLVANRGEIACRIIKTARRMGIKTVAVYSDADVAAQHTQLADEAWHIGPANVSESYLRADKIIAIAKASGAEAIHPGYGFLSENADFARQCKQQDIEFVGPPAEAIAAMGSKSAAKKIMSEAGVPMIPGYYGAEQSDDLLHQKANAIDYPVLLKAAAGGGGKGMRIVEQSADFLPSLASCRREAQSAFGDDEILIEKYIPTPRHIEIQIFADKHNHYVHLYERDCSIQRRYQKVFEEAPAPDLTEHTRKAMAEVAINAAKAIDYVGAGTVEFLYDEGNFYFMEMNTRLQVEHPVTEKITGVDLVEWQLIVAAGQELPLVQADIPCYGHAFETRIYAEDPYQDFLPATGKIQFMQTPNENRYIRIDRGVSEGDEISVYYDPMIAKLISWDESRSQALNRLKGALADFQIVGINTNLAFTHAIASHPEFEQQNISTAFISDHAAVLLAQESHLEALDYALAATYQWLKLQTTEDELNIERSQPNSPWRILNGWQNNLLITEQFYYQSEQSKGAAVAVNVNKQDNKLFVSLAESNWEVEASLTDHNFTLTTERRRFDLKVIELDNKIHLLSHGKHVVITPLIEDHGLDEMSTNDQVVAPMHGSLIKLHITEGDKVISGQVLMTLEAMKMEHSIQAPEDGMVEAIFYQEGDLVKEGTELLMLKTDG